MLENYKKRKLSMQTGADQRFLVRGLIRGWGFALLILSHFFLKYPMKMNMFGLIETKLFHFHRIFKNGSGGGSRGWFERTPSGSATGKIAQLSLNNK